MTNRAALVLLLSLASVAYLVACPPSLETFRTAFSAACAAVAVFSFLRRA